MLVVFLRKVSRKCLNILLLTIDQNVVSHMDTLLQEGYKMQSFCLVIVCQVECSLTKEEGEMHSKEQSRVLTMAR